MPYLGARGRVDRGPPDSGPGPREINPYAQILKILYFFVSNEIVPISYFVRINQIYLSKSLLTILYSEYSIYFNNKYSIISINSKKNLLVFNQF